MRATTFEREPPLVTIGQWIVTRWTKAARSAPLSARRSAVPEALPLPYVPALPDAGPFLWHQATYREEDQFATPVQVVRADEPFGAADKVTTGCVRVRLEAGLLIVRYTWTSWTGGAPKRSEKVRDVLHLQPGEWGRVVYNGRFSAWSHHGWTYHKTVLNVGRFRGVPHAPFAGEPAATFTDVADLR